MRTRRTREENRESEQSGSSGGGEAPLCSALTWLLSCRLPMEAVQEGLLVRAGGGRIQQLVPPLVPLLRCRPQAAREAPTSPRSSDSLSAKKRCLASLPVGDVTS